ncbi:unnamed protein product [Diplocarpon coronariae]
MSSSRANEATTVTRVGNGVPTIEDLGEGCVPALSTSTSAGAKHASQDLYDEECSRKKCRLM